jgi:hypothetical protein
MCYNDNKTTGKSKIRILIITKEGIINGISFLLFTNYFGYHRFCNA